MDLTPRLITRWISNTVWILRSWIVGSMMSNHSLLWSSNLRDIVRPESRNRCFPRLFGLSSPFPKSNMQLLLSVSRGHRVPHQISIVGHGQQLLDSRLPNPHLEWPLRAGIAPWGTLPYHSMPHSSLRCALAWTCGGHDISRRGGERSATRPWIFRPRGREDS